MERCQIFQLQLVYPVFGLEAGIEGILVEIRCVGKVAENGRLDEVEYSYLSVVHLI